MIYIQINVPSSIYSPSDRLIDFEIVDSSYSYTDADWADFERKYFYNQIEDLEELKSEYEFRKNCLSLLRREYEFPDIQAVLEEYIKQLCHENKITDEDVIEEAVQLCRFSDITDDNIIYILDNWDFSYLPDPSWEEFIKDIMRSYYRYRIVRIRPSYKLFKPTPVFITGIENIEKLPYWVEEFFSNCMDYNFMTFFFSTTNVQYSVKQASNYFFVSGSNPKLYDDYLDRKPFKGENGLKFWSHVRSTNQRFGFKKYRWESNREVPSFIDFDAIFNNVKG